MMGQGTYLCAGLGPLAAANPTGWMPASLPPPPTAGLRPWGESLRPRVVLPGRRAERYHWLADGVVRCSACARVHFDACCCGLTRRLLIGANCALGGARTALGCGGSWPGER